MITRLLEVRNQIHLNWTPRIDAQPMVKAIDHNIKCLLGSIKKYKGNVHEIAEMYVLTVHHGQAYLNQRFWTKSSSELNLPKTKFHYVIWFPGFLLFNQDIPLPWPLISFHLLTDIRFHITWRIHPYGAYLQNGYPLLSQILSSWFPDKEAPYPENLCTLSQLTRF